jgi:hypothetical protein
MTIFVIIDAKNHWWTYDFPSDRELKRTDSVKYSYDLEKQIAKKYNGSTWDNISLTNNSFTDGSNQLRFYPEIELYQFFSTKENEWLNILPL